MIVDAQECCCLGVARYARIDVTICDLVYLADVPLAMLVGIVLRPWGRGHAPQRRWVPTSPIWRGQALRCAIDLVGAVSVVRCDAGSISAKSRFLSHHTHDKYELNSPRSGIRPAAGI